MGPLGFHVAADPSPGGVGHASRSMLGEIRFQAHLQHAPEK